MAIERHIKLLGLKAEDRVTGMKGIITSISFDLYGCIQALITPFIKSDGSKNESWWMDLTRLKLLSKKSVIPVPDFTKNFVEDGKLGPADKPTF